MEKLFADNEFIMYIELNSTGLVLCRLISGNR